MKPNLLPFDLIESKSTSPKLTAIGGVPLVIETYRALGLPRVIDHHLHLKERGWEETTILESLVALQVAGGETMEDIAWLEADAMKELAGSVSFPSSSSVRRFLHLFDDGVSDHRVLGEAVVPEENEALRSLNELHRHVIRKIVERGHPRWITLDADATVVFSEKATCLATYKGGTGYQPIQAIWAEKQIVIAEEFRDGNVPASFDALGFLKKCEANLPKGLSFCLRSDGAWYQWDVMEYCTKRGIPFAIGADCSQGLMRFIFAIPEEQWKPFTKITAKGREQTNLEYAELEFSTASLPQEEIRHRMLQYRYIVLRKKNEQPDLFEGEYHYDAICTNMNWKPERLIAWHHERAGTIEHVIDRIKNDLGGGTLPCGTFGANAAWWRITCLTHNLVQCLKIIALPFGWFYLRMKTLRFRLFCIAGRIVHHARRIFLQLARGHPIFPTYRAARLKLAAL